MVGAAASFDTERMRPTIANVAMSDEPPDETNGSGFPTTGNHPTTIAMLRNAWNAIMMGPPATMVPKLSVAERAMRIPA